MSTWLERKFCPRCGKYLQKTHFGDIVCGSCGLVVYEKEKIDLTHIDPKILGSNQEEIADIMDLGRKNRRIFNIEKNCFEYSEPNYVTSKYYFLLLMGQFGVVLTRYYEASTFGEVIDYSRRTGYGYDILSVQRMSGEKRYVEVKTCLGESRSVSLTLSEYVFLIEKQSKQKWLYIVLLDRGKLLDKNYLECSDLFRVPCIQLQRSYFEAISSSSRILRYQSWRPVSERCRMIIPNELIPVLEQIRQQYLKLFPGRAGRILWYSEHIRATQTI